jgi:hypothetical protein
MTTISAQAWRRAMWDWGRLRHSGGFDGFDPARDTVQLLAFLDN